ncbi:DUF4132 domain-containing protein [Spirillospora sp. NBC_01491]|uniref:DUF4132 domain-containing protein n=1 Tax=Spirillospora sp. NBC_01491 TaxID=2976007 RepID=UPI002E348863|nr:DUF4132 domain-containing protein [Spirillospora sp. NBC_01491]
MDTPGASPVTVKDAPLDALPQVLVDPPWEQAARLPSPAKPKEPEPVLVPGLEPPAGLTIAWKPGEREEWAAITSYGHFDGDWAAIIEEYREPGAGYPPTKAGLLVQGPEELVRPLVAAWRPEYTSSYFWHSLRPIVARFELEAHAPLIHCVDLDPAGCIKALLPFLDAEVAVRMADWHFRLKSTHEIALTWLERHGLAAVPFLVPDALGKRRPARRKALAALWVVAGRHGRDAVADAARVHGDEAAEAVAEALRRERPVLDVAKKPAEGPPKAPKVPWADRARLPRLVLRDGGRVVPVKQARNVVSFMALSGTDPHEALEEVRELCTPASLAAFSRGVFEAWRRAGQPSRFGWVLTQLAWFGDDETVRLLTPIIRAWPGEARHAKAEQGLDVLAAIGTDVALIHLNGIARKVRYTGLRFYARSMIREAAEARGLTPEQLADRLVPDFELDAEGGMTLDYGPRSFRVGFDEQLKPYVVDDTGKLRKALPKPGVKDDPELAPAAYQRFSTLKKDVRANAADQIARLEAAMVTGRRWTPDDFRAFFLDHPLMWHIARRLIWTADDRPFRIAEDRTFAGVDDDAFALPDTAEIGIAHPLHLGDAVKAWSDVLADYEILQPFLQLGRQIHTLTEGERAGDRLGRFEGVTVPTGRVLGLTRHGWERGTPQDGGVEGWISVPAGGERWVVIDLDPGIAVGAVEVFPEQNLRSVLISPNATSYRSPREGTPTFGELEPVAASELIAQLTDLTRN